MLRLKNISKSFDGKTVLKNINLDIKKGEIVSILSPSGCGKTSLLNLMLGMTPVDSGQIIYNDEELTKVPMKKEALRL